MKNILFAMAATAVIALTSCSVGAGIQIRASENSTPKDSLKSSAKSDSAPKDSLQAPGKSEPIK